MDYIPTFFRIFTLVLPLLVGCGKKFVNKRSAFSESAKSSSVFYGDYIFGYTPEDFEVTGLWFKISSYLTGNDYCRTSPVAELFQVLDFQKTDLPEPLMKKNLDGDGSFRFEGLNDLDFNENNPYLVRITGCNKSLLRVITGSDDQEISNSSNILGFATIENKSNQKFQNGSFDENVRTLLAELEAALRVESEWGSSSKVYDALVSNAGLESDFKKIFSVDPRSLPGIAPLTTSLSIPSSGKEGDSLQLSTSAAHWDMNYKVAYLWKLDDDVLSNDRSFSFKVHGNMQRTHNLYLYIGRATEGGGFDTKSAYSTYFKTLKVTDDVPVTAPTFTVVGDEQGIDDSVIVNSSQLTVRINTGPSMSNCDSFSSLKVTESDVVPDPVSANFTIKCSKAVYQNVSYNLIDTDTVGERDLYLWAIDSTGKVSSPRKTTFVYDPMVASVFLSGAPTGESNVTDLDITVSGNNISHYRYKIGLSSITDCQDNQGYGSETDLVQHIEHDIASINDGEVKLCVLAKKDSGIWLSSTAALWTKDTEAPSSSISGALSGITAKQTNNVTVNGHDVVAYRYKLGLSASTDCTQAAGYSANISVITAITDDISLLSDGSMTLCVLGVDEAGNVQAYTNATTATWVKDTSAPTAVVGSAPTGSLNVNYFNNLVVSGDRVAFYKFKYGLVGSTDCADSSDYSGYLAISNFINIDTSSLSDGTMNLCVIGQNEANVAQSYADATVYQWTKDTEAPTATISGEPSSAYSNVTSLSVTVAGAGVVSYRYKIGLASLTNCAVSSGYSSSTLVENDINEDLSALSDQEIKLCVIGSDAAGNWQSYSSATIATWAKDTQVPTATLSGVPAGVSNTELLDVTVGDEEEATAYRYKLGAEDSTDCSIEAGYSVERGITTKIVEDMSAVVDGPMRLCVIARDDANNWQALNSATSAEWTKDTTPPGNFSISALSSFVTTSTPTVTWAVSSGADSYVVSIDGDDDCDVPFVQQHTNVTSTSLELSSLNEGSYYICVIAVDDAGNVRTADNQGSSSFTVDTLAPSIQVSTFSLPIQAGTVTVNWTITEVHAASADTATIEITSDDSTWSTLATPVIGVDGPFTSLTMSTSVGIPSWDVGTARIRIRFTDAAGLEGVGVSNLFVIDNTPPVVKSLVINDGDPVATSNYLRASITAEEEDPAGSSMISHVCLRYINSNQPSATDSCWVPITPTHNLNLSDFYFRVGFAPGTYTVFAFVKDRAGNISAISDNGNGVDGVDKKSIDMYPGKAPVISRVSATNVAVPDHPPSVAQLQVPEDSTVYIKWKATDNEGFGSTPISLSYTTDGTTFTGIASNLLNGSNSGCTVNEAGTTWDDEATGCYVWTNGSPTSTYYRIRVTAVDSDGMIAFSQSDALNLPHLRFLAGNTEAGLGGSAVSALFQTSAVDSRAQKLVVLPSGRIFVIDSRGLITVDPVDGVQRLLIPTSGSVSGYGDGGSVESARLRAPYRIALTYDGNILISDYDRIRKIDTSESPMTIDTLIGGGSQTGDGVNARDFQITASNFSYSSLIPLPNGDVIFQRRAFVFGDTNAEISIERYVAATGKITSNIVSGMSDFIREPQANLSYCRSRNIGAAVNTSTGDITKLVIMLDGGANDGLCPAGTSVNEHSFSTSLNPVNLTADNQNPGPLHNNSSNKYWRDFYYEFASGLDGNLYAFSTAAASTTKIFKYNHSSGEWTALVDRAWIGECDDSTIATNCNMKIHSMFVDAQGKFYFIDGGTVRTIQDDGTLLTLVGQRDSYGEGLASDARFASISGIDVWTDNDVTKVVLSDDVNYRIREFVIGGDIQTLAGTGTKASPSDTTPAVSQSVAWGGDTRNAYLSLDSSGNIFTHRQIGTLGILNRSTGLWSNLTTGFVSYGPVVLGRSSTKLLVGDFTNSGGRNPELWEVVIATGVKTKIAAYVGSGGDFCDDGTSLMACIMPYFTSNRVSYGGWDSVDQQWYLKYLNVGNSKRIVTLKDGVMGTLTTLQNSSSTFAYRYNGDKTINTVYYCGADGLIYKHDVNQPLANDVLMPYNVPGMLCTRTHGQMLYDATRNTLMFTYTLNNLPGIAEFLSPAP